MDYVCNILNRYNLKATEKEELLKLILPIYQHEEFLLRTKEPFMHHGNISLGEHIIEDAVVTYLLSKKYRKKHPNYNLSLAVKIAMLHDLYTIPWQNNALGKVKHFYNKHGFRHPIEAVINAVNWYPDLFADPKEASVIIDGIMHHMFPLPVRRFNLKKDMELKNKDLLENMPDIYQEMLFKSSKRKRIGPISISRCLYKEGKIMAKADKRVSLKQIKHFRDAEALLTGHNKRIDKSIEIKQ